MIKHGIALVSLADFTIQFKPGRLKISYLFHADVPAITANVTLKQRHSFKTILKVRAPYFNVKSYTVKATKLIDSLKCSMSITLLHKLTHFLHRSCSIY